MGNCSVIGWYAWRVVFELPSDEKTMCSFIFDVDNYTELFVRGVGMSKDANEFIIGDWTDVLRKITT